MGTTKRLFSSIDMPFLGCVLCTEKDGMWKQLLIGAQEYYCNQFFISFVLSCRSIMANNLLRLAARNFVRRGLTTSAVRQCDGLTQAQKEAIYPMLGESSIETLSVCNLIIGKIKIKIFILLKLFLL